MNERTKKAHQERECLKQSLEARYGMVGHPKANLLFEMAWEFGHSAGLNEVEIYYLDFLELVDRPTTAPRTITH